MRRKGAERPIKLDPGEHNSRRVSKMLILIALYQNRKILSQKSASGNIDLAHSPNPEILQKPPILPAIRGLGLPPEEGRGAPMEGGHIHPRPRRRRGPGGRQDKTPFPPAPPQEFCRGQRT